MLPVQQGLRERKKAKTRRDIVIATLELALERGYAATSIAAIAERANVAPRTVSLYFPAKDEIAFDRSAEIVTSLREALAVTTTPLVDRLVDWMMAMSEHTDPEVEQLRLRASKDDLALRALERHWLDQIEQAIAEAAALDVGMAAEQAGPRMFAAAFIGMVIGLRENPPSDDDLDPSQIVPRRELDFLRAGLGVLRGADARA